MISDFFFRGLRKLNRIGNLLRLRAGYKVYGIEYVNRALSNEMEPASILRAFGAHIDHRVAIHPFPVIHEACDSYSNLSIAKNVSVSRCVFFDLSGPITIEENCSIGMRALLFTHSDFRRSIAISRLYPRRVEPIVLCHDTVIGAGAVILPGVRVNSFSIVAAGAVVVSEVPAYSLAAGNPARVVKRLDLEQSDAAGKKLTP
jgi:acetyltransferase-like isoleucine patch superfamily enzyme